MRNRFLPTDDASRGPIQTLDFVYLPLPRLPPPDNPPFSAVFLRSIDEIRISASLRKSRSFRSKTLSQYSYLTSFLTSSMLLIMRNGIVLIAPRKMQRLCLWRGAQRFVMSKKQVVSLGSDKQEIQDGANSVNDGQKSNKFVQFEIPEMDISLLSPKISFHSHKEFLHIFSEISDAECTMDLLSSEIKVHNHLEIQQSVYSVDDMNMEYSMDKKVDLPEDACSVQGELLSHNIEFPVFEVDEETMGIVGNKYMMDELLNFENIEILQLAQPYEMISNNKEVLGSVEFDLIKDLLHHNDAKKCLEDTDYSSHLDYISVVDLSNIQEYSVFQCEKPEDDSIWLTYPIFDEYMFFDLDPYTFREVFADAANEIEAETCESMFGEAMNFRSFSELIVCHELTLMDDSFKSLPVPILPEHGHTRSLHSMIEELLTQVDWQSSSASDGLYLDWHYLREDGCDMINYSSCWKMLGEIETYNTDAALNLCDGGRLIFDFILSEDVNKHNAENDKEKLDLPSCDVSVLHASSGKADSTSLSNHGDGKVTNEDFLLKSSVEKVPLFGESMSSDLDFFLNPRNYITGRENMPAGKSVNTKTVCQVFMTSDDSTDAKAPVQQKWDVQLHQVKLSDSILLLIDFLSKHFLAFLENEKELIHKQQYQTANDLTLLQIPKEKLMSRLGEKLISSTYYAQKDDDVMVLAMLCAIKQMAFYLCYYGVQATYLYLDKLITNLQFVKSRLSFLYNMIRDEYEKAEKELCIIHPSISIVQGILQTNLSHSSSKILIVSDRVFWWPLRRLLTFMNISYNEPQSFSIHPNPQYNCSEITDTTINMMLSSDCCLVSHDYVSASFPFSKFSLILEYGGSDESSRISSIFPKLNGFPTLYFLKVELEELSIAKALSDGVGMPKSIELKYVHYRTLALTQRALDCPKKDPGSKLVQSKSKLEELLNTIPVKEAYDNGPINAVNEGEDCTKMPFQSMSVGSELRQNLPCKPFCSDIVIIVNTRNLNEEMVISRRSTYQRILGMEKEGAEIIERDISLPVDLIVSAAVSLTWYDCRNIGKKASAPDEAFSCLPLCVESIAASILTSLSFAFNCSILVISLKIRPIIPWHF
ncbi:hypothetical protein RD792_005359 [Penstemon davidsonii]|uniref:Uncharacterized protein n=1 Tax=Penstemon davidsonii TaxID=160366 RepID=A0ABR0DKQ8_9LAMI|nr:hypothetical protein RD792_005359 [Penstemon davidsonii]